MIARRRRSFTAFSATSLGHIALLLKFGNIWVVRDLGFLGIPFPYTFQRRELRSTPSVQGPESICRGHGFLLEPTGLQSLTSIPVGSRRNP